jgi:hypothetical protein
VKPLPSIPYEPATPPLSPYRDDPSANDDAESVSGQSTASPTPQHRQPAPSAINTAQAQVFYEPYRDDVFNDDDVPLAHLCSYPTEAPPSYHVAVRESFRATLVQHIPTHSVSSDVDTEAGIDIDFEQADDVRFTVERFVAAIIVSMMLLVCAALLALITLTSFRT